jgi:hypothetical protein
MVNLESQYVNCFPARFPLEGQRIICDNIIQDVESWIKCVSNYLSYSQSYSIGMLCSTKGTDYPLTNTYILWIIPPCELHGNYDTSNMFFLLMEAKYHTIYSPLNSVPGRQLSGQCLFLASGYKSLTHLRQLLSIFVISAFGSSDEGSW